MVLDKMDKIETEIEGKAQEKEITLDEKIVQIVIGENSGMSLDDFQENDKKVLSVLNQDNEVADNQYTFNGLARKLGMHQQSLARSLHRLETSGLVERSQTGYKLSKSLRSILVQKSRLDLEELAKKISKHNNNEFVQVLQLYIPTSIEVGDIVSRLVGKWFGNLRWIGLVEGDGGYVLQWTDGNSQMNLKIVSRYAIVESNSVGEKERAEAMVSAYRIFEQITKVMQKPKGGARNSLDSFNQYN